MVGYRFLFADFKIKFKNTKKISGFFFLSKKINKPTICYQLFLKLNKVVLKKYNTVFWFVFLNKNLKTISFFLSILKNLKPRMENASRKLYQKSIILLRFDS